VDEGKLKVRTTFEPSRVGEKHLIDAYAQVVPEQRRRVGRCVAQMTSVSEGARGLIGGDHDDSSSALRARVI
jgi:hypothetical protein